MRSRKLLVALAGLAVLVAAGAVVLWPWPDRITPASFERIHDGMTRAEVDAILGPAGDFRTKESIVLEPPSWNRNPESGVRLLAYDQWITDAYVATVAFNPASGVVTGRWLTDNVGYEQPVLEVVLWRTKRQWRRWFP